MLFTEARFLLFFIIVFAVYWTLKNGRLRIAFLTAASYVFYGAWDFRFLALIGFVTLVTFAAGKAIPKANTDAAGNRIMMLSALCLLGVLGVFKYFNFFTLSFIQLADWAGLPLSQPVVNIILPVGISFYVFQAISYIVDVKRGVIPGSRSLLDVAFFVGFFPQLVAGPIVRAGEFFPQMVKDHHIRELPVKGILVLFLGGFLKKAVIADNIAPIFVDPVFADPSLYSAPAIILSVFAYAVQIYCDFSGYSEMAIATSRSFGYRLPRNFNAPYLSTSITEFWRRWHISLSHWLRDYLYISLGGNRGGAAKTYRNLMLTMILGGLWHGASWNFVIWGALHGGVLSIERFLGISSFISRNVWTKLLGGMAAFYIVCLCWVFFRAVDLNASLYMAGAMLGAGASGETGFSIAAWLMLAGLAAAHAITFRFFLGERLAALPDLVFYAAIGVWVALMLPFIPTEVTPFIYFQF